MATVAFDTLKFAQNLRAKAHLTTEQAEGFAEALSDTITDDLASKGDITLVRREIKDSKTELRGEIQNVKTELRGEIEQLRGEIKDTKIELLGEISKVKSDMKDMRTELQTNMEKIKTELQTNMESIKTELKLDIAKLYGRFDLMQWMMGFILAGIAALVLKTYFMH